MSGLRKGLLLALVLVPVTVAGAWWVLKDDQRSSTAGHTRERWTLDQVRAFGDYPVFYLGEEFEGQRPALIIRTVFGDDANLPLLLLRDSFTFIYCECDLNQSGDFGETMDVYVTPRCNAPQELIQKYITERELPPSPILPGPGGSEVQFYGGTHVWIGEVVVVIAGDTSPEEQLRAVDALRAINSPFEATRPSPPNKAPCTRILGRDRDAILTPPAPTLLPDP